MSTLTIYDISAVVRRTLCCMLLSAAFAVSSANAIGSTGAAKSAVIRITGGDSEKNPVHLTLASQDTKIMGTVAVTTMNLIVANESGRVLEGELEFPLEQDERIVGYAIDVNGRLRQGVVVEKDKGRQVFEAVVRQGIDPGLVEQTAGNNFKTRIYPIPAKGIRQIQIVYQGMVKDSSQAVMERVFTETIGKDTYFYYGRRLSVVPRVKPLPKSLTVWWDISGSGTGRNVTAEISFLQAYISRLADPTVTIVPFCNEMHEAHRFTGKAADVAEQAGQFLKTLEYDGATNLSYDFAGVMRADKAAAGGREEILVFTDGLGNWNDSYAKKTTASLTVQTDSGSSAAVCVYTINSAVSADHAWLADYAQKNGGQYINLTHGNLQDHLTCMSEEPFRLIRAEYDEKAVSDLYPVLDTDASVTTASAAEYAFSLTGLLKKKQAEVRLYFGHGNSVEESCTVLLSAVSSIESGHVARQWADRKISVLYQNYNTNKTEIIALAKRFGIVTKDTSLIVLDSAADYVRYGIVPPESDKALCEEYNVVVARQGNTTVKTDGGKGRKIPESVYRTFEEFKTWWNTSLEEFKKKPVPDDDADDGIIRPLHMMESVSVGVSDAADMAAAVRRSAPLALHAAAESADTSADSGNTSGLDHAPRIQLQAWSPKAEYLSVLKKTSVERMYAVYLLLKKENGSSPAFYMEVSDYFADEGLEHESLRILSNLAELELENTDVLRALANKLVERNMHALAIPVFEKLVTLKSEVPQFYRDLGMAYYMSGDVQKAVDTLYSVVCRQWDGRFEQVQQIALNDMNAIIAACSAHGGQGDFRGQPVDTSAFDKNLLKNFDVDVRIILTWNTDDCDVDLWVTDDDGEKCFYGNRITRNGGRLSRDFTQGYGPEEFCIRKAPGGKLRIEANYFGSTRQKLLQPVTVQAEVYTNFGRPDQKRQVMTLQLNEVKGTFLIGDVSF